MGLRPAVCLLLLALASASFAGDGAPLTAEQRAEVARIYGGEAKWAELPRWRQEMIEANYADFLRLPDAKRERLASDARRLREHLLEPRRKLGRDELPATLRADVERMPREIRPLATRLAILRLRQVRLDRGLARVPAERRWDLFRRLFPEPFDADVARKAYAELRGYLKRDVKAKLVARLEERGVDPEKRPEVVRKLFREIAAAEEREVVEKVRRELFRVKAADARRVRRLLEKRGVPILERPGFATPRQKELIRYCLMPQECPLLDLGFLGPRPARGPDREAWDRDYQYFARIELLFEAHLPREMVLHLAATGTPQDLLRAFRALRGAKSAGG
jgi:hypothetical protein